MTPCSYHRDQVFKALKRKLHADHRGGRRAYRQMTEHIMKQCCSQGDRIPR